MRWAYPVLLKCVFFILDRKITVNCSSPLLSSCNTTCTEIINYRYLDWKWLTSLRQKTSSNHTLKWESGLAKLEIFWCSWNVLFKFLLYMQPATIVVFASLLPVGLVNSLRTVDQVSFLDRISVEISFATAFAPEDAIETLCKIFLVVRKLRHSRRLFRSIS